jgi:hypothetical protein
LWIEEVPGDHGTINTGTNLKILARKLAGFLDDSPQLKRVQVRRPQYHGIPPSAARIRIPNQSSFRYNFAAGKNSISEGGRARITRGVTWKSVV